MPLPTVHAAVPPFRLSSSHKDAFAHPSWRRVEREALAVAIRGGRLNIFGLPGTGKTLMLRAVEQKLRGLGRISRLLRPGDALDLIADTDVLLVDEAGTFSTDELRRICQRPNPVVLAGLPGSFRAGPADHVALEPLSPEDVARFVAARLTASGRPCDLFTPQAVLTLAHRSNGLLRLIVILASAALFFAERRGASQVTLEDVDEAVVMRSAVAEAEDAHAEPAPSAMLRPVAHKPKPRLWPAVRTLSGSALFACGGLAIVLLAVAAALAVDAPLAPQLVAAPPPLLASAASPPEPDVPQALEATKLPLPLALVPAISPTPASPPSLAPTSTLPPELAQAAAPEPPPLAPTSTRPPVLAQAAAPEPPPLAPTSTRRPVLAQAAVPQSPPPLAPTSTPPPELAQAAAPEPPLLVPNAAERPRSVLVFAGPIMNHTMGQGGQLSLQLRTDGAGHPIGAWFHASHGLIGTGRLTGEIGPHGHLTLSGRLMMGRNPFECALRATLDGDRLIGEATFVRDSSGATAHSSFTLIRS